MSKYSDNSACAIVALLMFIALSAVICAGFGSGLAQRDIAAKCDAEGTAAIAGSAYRCERITHKPETSR